MSSFTLIKDSNRRLNVQVAKQIARKILSGEFKENQKLPSEMELCESFGVSRTALRESTKLLTSKGLIESKPKVGTHICPRTQWHFLDPQLLEWIQDLKEVQGFLAQFLDLRKAIEPEACALAAINANADQRKELSIIFQNMTQAAQSFDLKLWTENDHKFHQMTFLATENMFYLPFANILSTMFSRFLYEAAEGGRFCLTEHQAIYDAIMAGNADAAREASSELLKDANQRLAQVG